ncbi:MAG TPA: SMP-30/gluconolactonase/LRE family protein [Geminicoccaceae bacterium]|nr:SMP-30/gluconolactonase/LRE family protein [Geminicoccus sp.]HMU49263.1 SMP-30/gluconolactonase/LRE family protein [Geminicoccaceae bacterium]
MRIVLDARNAVGEGPFWDDREGALWWVDIVGNAVLCWRPGETEARRWPVPGFPCAVIGRRGGGMLLARAAGLDFFDPDTGSSTPFLAPEADRPANRGNEAKCDAAGRLWLGTMQSNLEADGSPREMTARTGALYRVLPDGGFSREVDGVGLSNTLAWTDGGRSLIFGDTLANSLWKYTVGEDGRLGDRRLFSDATLPGFCDGSAIDAEGCLWNARFAGSCVVRFAPDGSVDRILDLPVTNPTSCCFGGEELRTLYVTSARFGLTAAQLAANPREGALLAVDAGVAGTASERFGG